MAGSRNDRFNINEFRNTVAAQGGLSRGVFYDCFITPEGRRDSLNEDSVLILCKAANLPTTQLDFTDLKYFTRSVKVPAARQFQPITLTFYNSQNYELRDQFLQWLSRFNSPVNNIRQSGKNYATIALMPKDNKHDTVGVYRFEQAFPTSISGLQYSYENDAQFQTYDVEFQYLTATFDTVRSPAEDQELLPARFFDAMSNSISSGELIPFAPSVNPQSSSEKRRRKKFLGIF